MNFENALVRPLASGKTRIVDVTQGVHRIPFDGAGCTDPAHHHDEPGGGHGHEGDDGLDPHVWLSMENAAVIAANICAALCEADPAHADEYRRNLAALQKELAETDGYVKKNLPRGAGANSSSIIRLSDILRGCPGSVRSRWNSAAARRRPGIWPT